MTSYDKRKTTQGNGVEISNNLHNVDQFHLDDQLEVILRAFNCCGLDYALVNESFTWCAPLHHHLYAYRFHGGKSRYRYEDPYLNYDLIALLPRFCHLSEIAVHAKAWQDLFTPEHSKYGDCYAISYYFWLDNSIHRFILYFEGIHNILSLYLRVSDLYHMLNKLISHIAPLITKYFDEFTLYSEQLTSLTLPPHWLKTAKDKNIQLSLNLSDKEMQYFTLLGRGITEKNTLAERMKVSSRSVDNYTQHLKQVLGLAESYELFDYAKRYWLLM